MNSSRRAAWLAPAIVAIALGATRPSVVAAAPSASELRCAPQEASAQAGVASPSPLERARRDCPLLGAIIEEYAMQDLGEAFPEDGAAAPSPEIDVATRFAALGDIATMKRHARLARDAGATPAAFKELLYLTAVNAGIPKAVEATRALSDVFTTRLMTSGDNPMRIIATSREACARYMRGAALSSGEH